MKNLIYVVEDDKSIRELYDYAAVSAGFDVKTFETAKEMFSGLKVKKPDIFLLDIMLDDMDGFEILKTLKEDPNYLDIPVIMISAKDEEITKVKCFDFGATDYITKPFGILELIARIKVNIKKGRDKIKTYKDIVIDDTVYTVTINNQSVKISPKAYSLLNLLIENNEKVVKREDIFNVVWGYDYIGETRTLDMHINEIRKLLKENNSKCYINTIRSIGYVLKCEEK